MTRWAAGNCPRVMISRMEGTVSFSYSIWARCFDEGDSLQHVSHSMSLDSTIPCRVIERRFDPSLNRSWSASKSYPFSGIGLSNTKKTKKKLPPWLFIFSRMFLFLIMGMEGSDKSERGLEPYSFSKTPARITLPLNPSTTFLAHSLLF